MTCFPAGSMTEGVGQIVIPIHDQWAGLMEPLMQFRPDGKVDAGPL